MPIEFKDLIDLGGTIVVVFGFIWLLYQQNKQKKQPFNNGMSKLILDELKTQNANHLQGISRQIGELCDKINENNDRLIDTIHQDNQRVSQLLGEIKGILSRK